MKKILLILAALLLVLSLTGCTGKDSEPKMYIQPAKLTDEENAIAQLLGAGQNHSIYDFKVDENVQSMHVDTYELIDGQWEMISGGGGMACTVAEGRVALEFDVIPDGMRIAVQDENGFFAASHDTAEPLDTGDMSRSTSKLSESQEIEYGRVVPIAVQIITSKTEIRSFVPQYFFTPEEYAQYDYEHVYALTIAFDTEPLQ